jgi:hypothetical protein
MNPDTLTTNALGSKPRNFRPFDSEKAFASEPFSTLLQKPVRILCWDRKSSDKKPIMGLIDSKYDGEIPMTWTIGGSVNVDGSPDIHDLIMIPVGTVDGQPVYNGDLVRDKDGNTGHINLSFEHKRYNNFELWKKMKGSTWKAPASIIKDKPIVFKGHLLQKTDYLWYKPGNDDYYSWRKVAVGDTTITVKGVSCPELHETHFEYLTRLGQRGKEGFTEIVESMYSW